MACPACRTEHPGWGRFCNACGAELAGQGVSCTSCGAANVPGARFCSGCGQKLAVTLCFNCATWNPVGRTHCVQCQAAWSRPAEMESGAGLPLTDPTAEPRRWKLEPVVLVRIVPEGLAELMRSAPVEAARYHGA